MATTGQARHHLRLSPSPNRAKSFGGRIYLGQRAFRERPRLEVTLCAHRGGGKVGDPELGDVVVQRHAVGVEELAELGITGQMAALG
jgi:hypothetical protein